MQKTELSETESAIFVAVADYFKVLSESSRLQILICLKSGPMNVMDIGAVTGLGQANLSKHLKVLTQAGILSRQPKGTSAFYEIIDPMIFELCELVCERISERVLKQAENLKAIRTKKAIF